MVELVIAEIGTFKGPVLKIGQLLGGISVLPLATRLRIQQALATTRHLPAELFFAVFKTEQGKAIDHFFTDFDPNPIGVGSMGQVFKAKLKDGTPVAVKIHYPELQKNVEAFGRLYRLVGLIIRHVFPRNDVPTIQKMVMSIVLDECDMRKEAAMHQAMGEQFNGVGDLIIPKVYHEYTSPSVLVTEYIPGLRLFEFVPQASYEERRKFCNAIEFVIVAAVERLNLLQFDPHGGNYLYHDGKIVCLDFGSMTRISPEAAATYLKVVRALHSRDEKKLYAALVETKVLDPRQIPEDLFCATFAPYIMQRRHQNYNAEEHAITHIYQLFSNDEFRHALSIPPELFLGFVAYNFLVIMKESLNLGQPDPLPSDRLTAAS
jgi:predicted unusual protein kinase regulating ubiquinone biosynthesis (AarF/ABC1/UbiB family)